MAETESHIYIANLNIGNFITALRANRKLHTQNPHSAFRVLDTVTLHLFFSQQKVFLKFVQSPSISCYTSVGF